MSDVAAAAAVPALSAQPAAQPSPPLGRSLWSHGGFSFKDLLDIVNPLQHLPVVGSIYRYLTGDEPAAGTRIIGDALYGGPIGFGVSVVSNALLTNAEGQDLGERLLADVFGPRDHDSSPTLGTPQVATADEQAPMPAWMASVGTPDGQPRTPAPANRQNAATRIASASAPLPTSPAQPTASPTLVPLPAQPVAMNQLFRSAPPAATASPEQAFMAQASQFQHQISQGRGTNGAVLNNHPVPLELSANLLPVMPAGGHLALGPRVASDAGQAKASGAAPPSQAQASKTATGNAPDQNAIAQKMIDALNKYELLKKQEQQQDSAEKTDRAKLDLAL